MKLKGKISAANISRKQYLVFAACLFAGFMFLRELVSSDAEDVVVEEDSGSRLSQVVLDLSRPVAAEKFWLDNAEQKFRNLENQLKRVVVEGEIRDDRLSQVLESNDKLRSSIESERNDALVALEAQAKEIERLRGELDRVRTQQEKAANTTGSFEQKPSDNPFPGDALQDQLQSRGAARGEVLTGKRRGNNQVSGTQQEFVRHSSNVGTQGNTTRSSLSLISFNLDEKVNNYRKTANYVAVGSYASAVVVSGVDAGVGVNNQSNPRPVLFRVTGPAISTVASGQKQMTDIEGCLVTGAAIGDLSSEKVYVRLEWMSCSRKAGEVYEIEVEGYMAGAGKSGVRGIVVERSGDFILKAFLAGTVSGLGRSYAQSFQPTTSVTSGTVSTSRQSFSDSTRAGIGEGLSSAGDRISEYLIQRAEQYQPVVVMQSGTNVELVFLRGFSLEPDVPSEDQQRVEAPTVIPATGPGSLGFQEPVVSAGESGVN